MYPNQIGPKPIDLSDVEKLSDVELTEIKIPDVVRN